MTIERELSVSRVLRKALRRGLESASPDARERLFKFLMPRVSDRLTFSLGFPNMAGCLENTKLHGFLPGAILDVGAFVGDWSRMAASIFPAAQILMFDGDPKSEAALRDTQQQLGTRCQYWITLLGSETRASVTLYQLPGGGSSVLQELTTFERQEIRVPMTTLDELAEEAPNMAPLLMKLDVQGFELEVLRGARNVLSAAEIVILETSLLPYNESAPLFAEVVSFMDDAGFAAYDFCGQFRRQTDSALCQVDVAFVRESSALRTRRKFWLHEP